MDGEMAAALDPSYTDVHGQTTKITFLSPLGSGHKLLLPCHIPIPCWWQTTPISRTHLDVMYGRVGCNRSTRVGLLSIVRWPSVRKMKPVQRLANGRAVFFTY